MKTYRKKIQFLNKNASKIVMVINNKMMITVNNSNKDNSNKDKNKNNSKNKSKSNNSICKGV